MRTYAVRIIAAVLSLCLLWPSGVFAQAQTSEAAMQQKPTTQDGRYGQGDQGWFFYHDPKEAPPPPEQVPPTPEPSSSSPAKPAPLSAEWIRDNLPKYRFAAIDNPTKDNVELYLLLQKLMMDKAEQFALAHRKYAEQNPGIDETVQNPTSEISRRSMTTVQEDQQNAITRKIAQRVGIYYFFRSDCPYCHVQNQSMDVFTGNTGLTVVPISLDGLPSEDGLLPNWRPDQGQGAYLGVTKTPTMFAVDPDGKVVLLSVGVRSIPELRSRLIEIARDEGWITQHDYDLAMRGLPRRFITEGLDGKAIEDDPKQLLQLLRGATTYGKTEASYDDVAAGGASDWLGRRQSQ